MPPEIVMLVILSGCPDAVTCTTGNATVVA